MINKIDNNFSFKANLKPSVRIKEQARFDNIQELFSKLTKEYPNETLYLSKSEKHKLALHTSNLKYCISRETIITDFLRILMEKYTDIEIAIKFSDAFKVLRLKDISKNLTKKIEYNKENFKKNILIANNLRNFGRNNAAEKYDKFAQFDKDNFENLSIQFNDLKNSFKKQQAISSTRFPEVLQIQI